MQTQTPTTLIRAESGARDYWRDLWRYRELFYFLAWRDVLVRYKQTVIGVVWALLRPLLTMGIFVVVFSTIARLPSIGSVPYPIMVFAAMLPWQFFSSALSGSAESLIGNSNMVSKVYFPRLIMPVSTVAPSFIDFAVSLAIMAVLYVAYGFVPDWHIVLLPVFLVMLLLLSFGLGIFLAALNVSYRDFRYVIPFLLQVGLYISPIGYASTVVPDQWRILYSLNPVVGIIDGFRWALLGEAQDFYWPSFALAWVGILISLWIGIRYFRRVELYFADRI